MNTLFKPDTTSVATGKSWKFMNTPEKMLFAAKVGIMIASFGWIYGNTIAPDEVNPIKNEKTDGKAL
jgi:hypothetical protein